MRARTTVNQIFILGFLLALWLPLLATFAGMRPRDTGPRDENVAAVPALHANWKSVKTFPNRLRKYVNDRFGFRDTLVQWHGVVKVNWLGISSSRRVLMGKRGWLFYADEGGVEDYRATKPFTEAELSQWTRVLEIRRSWLARQGIHYLFVIVPNTPMIYPEYLPDNITRARSETRFDQLKRYLKAHSNFDILDLHEPLMRAKPLGQLYQQTDTHWNPLGAYIGYQEIMTRLKAWYPNVKAAPLSDFEIVHQQRPGGDLARVMGLKNVMKENYVDLLPRQPQQARYLAPSQFPFHGPEFQPPLFRITERKNADIPRAVVIHDSFGEALIPFLAEHFGRATFAWRDRFEPDLILREKPNVVIQILVERKLQYPVNALVPEEKLPESAASSVDNRQASKPR
jgi:hypothetical protein